MTFPYPLVSNFTSSFNTASYFPGSDVLNYNQKTNLSDLFFGKSARDLIEFSYFNTIGEQNGFSYKTPSIKYLSEVGIYKDVDQNSITYNYRKTKTDYINYKNNFLIDIQSDLSSSNIFDGQHLVSYNFIRNLAGNQNYPLIISDISPSRTELKLIPSFVKRSNDNIIFYENLAYESFSRKLVLIEDILDLVVSSTEKFNCDENYKLYSQENPDQISYFKNSFGFKSDEDAISFINQVYNGSNEIKLNLVNQITIKNLFGVNNYIKYWLYTYSKNILSFDELYQQIKYVVEKEYLNQLTVINIFDADLAINLQIISNTVYELFVKQVITIIQNIYVNKFYSYYKNSLNFGNGVIIRYIDHSFSNENETDDKHIELLIKLDSPLPNEFDVKSRCWISNVSIAPIVQSVILINKTESKNFQISGPDFSISIINSEKNSINNISSLGDNVTNRDLSLINVTKKLKNLNVDYSDFSNFVVFSSVALRIKIFKNKLESINLLNSNISSSSVSASSATNIVISSSFSSQITNYNNTIDEILNSFDGFESYLYTNQSLVDGSLSNVNSNYYNYVLDAEEFDIENIDSLVNNTPENIKNDENNSDYLLFLSMIGHHFDNIYLYIKSFPILNNGESSDSYISDFVYYMLKTFGWNTSTDFSNKSEVSAHLSNTMSYKDKTESIWKRILDTLPQIYKTKGTQECINLILACHGIPLNILTIREFGNNDVYKNKKTTYLYNQKYYFTKFESNNEYLRIPYSGSKSIEFTFKLNKNYQQNQTVELANKNESAWRLFLQKDKRDQYGNIIFQIQDRNLSINNVPIFNNDVFFNVLLRRNNTSSLLDPSNNEDYVPIKYDLIVKSYDGDRQTFSHSSSIVLTRTYNEYYSSNGFLNFGNYKDTNDFTGLLDKINLINNPILDYDFDQYSKNYDYYGNNKILETWENLYYKYSYDYPINLQSSSGFVPIYPNFPEGKSYPTPTASAYNFNYNSVTQSSDCVSYSQSVYPYQFEVVELPQTIIVSKYGPNKLKNNKIRKIDQILTAYPSPVQSVAKNTDVMSPDSNILGVYVSPFKVKDDDILNFYGDLNMMNYIGDPGNVFESSYKSLTELRENYYKYNGSRVLYQEFITLFKNYIDNSIFDTIKNIIPARTKYLSGIVVEPSILERPRFAVRPIYKEEIPSYNVSVNLIDDITADLFPSDTYNINLNVSDVVSHVKSGNLNDGYFSSDGNEYYFNEYIQSNIPFYDKNQKTICFLRKIQETQEIYSEDKLQNPITINLCKIVSVPSSSVAKQIGDDYIVTANDKLYITNIYPFQHLSYKNKPFEKFSVYLNTSSYVPSYTDSNGNILTVSNTSLGSLNINQGQFYVKSRNTEDTNIISPYEITSSTSTSSLSYSPVLTQSLSLSQSIFII
jgi:hypothetical protein